MIIAPIHTNDADLLRICCDQSVELWAVVRSVSYAEQPRLADRRALGQGIGEDGRVFDGELHIAAR